MAEQKSAKYKRILLKLSGEALMGEMDFGIDPKVLDRMALEIAQLRGIGVQVALVIGGASVRNFGASRAKAKILLESKRVANPVAKAFPTSGKAKDNFTRKAKVILGILIGTPILGNPKRARISKENRKRGKASARPLALVLVLPGLV